MKVKVVHRNLRISPQKVAPVCRLINNKPLSEAYKILASVDKKKVVKLLIKLLLEASANAVNNYALRGDSLQVEECLVLKGGSLKRSFPRAKGRADVRIHRFTNLSVTLGEKERTSQRETSGGIVEGEELSTKKLEEQIGEERA